MPVAWEKSKEHHSSKMEPPQAVGSQSRWIDYNEGI